MPRVLKEAEVNFEYEIEEIARKDSLYLSDDDRRLLRERIEASPERLILITHGTDTMVQTALSLQGLADKTIVLTGALRPARFKKSDASFNVGCAVGAVQALPSGVYIAMSGRVFPAEKVRKNREAGRFEELD